MLSLLASIALAAHIATPVEDTAQARRLDLMSKLRSGGYSVLLRHARTDYSVQEPQGTVPAERSAQRNLSDDGIRDAALIGVVFRKYGVSFAEIISSPMFRTVETAQMVAGTPKTTMALRVFPSTPEQATLIKTAPKRGTNRLIVTHHFVIETHVPGVKPGAVGESEAAVVSHAADGTPQLLGIIKLDDWKALANPGSGTSASAASAPTATSVAVISHRPPSAEQPSGVPAVIPETPAGRLVRGYLAAFNSGDANTMRAFLESSFVANPSRPMDERIKSYLGLLEEHGALSLVSIDSSTTTKVGVGVRSKRGALSVILETSAAEPFRVSSVTFATFGPHR